MSTYPLDAQRLKDSRQQEERPNFATNGQQKIAYFEYGPSADEAPTVVITGGWPWNSSRHVHFALRLADLGLHVIRYDQRGSGASSHPHGVDAYSMPNLAEDLGAVLDAATPKDKKVYIFGEAWGPFIGCEYTNINPDRIASIISVGGPSLDVGFGTLVRLTKEAADDHSLIEPVAKQWAALSYQFAISIPVLPELLFATGIPTVIVNLVTLAATDALDELIKDPLSIIDQPTNVHDTIYGINKYRWFIYNRFPHPKYDYINVPLLKVFQLDGDFIETEILLDGLENQTPNLEVSYVTGNHLNYLLGETGDKMVEGIFDAIEKTQ
ncbi:alpha/beta fold hydrolase [Carnimonas bestiolae]|uniref:alpha/beta fold hydrolase n=1 Tax=Carnimonas bestiolae TaxID=3402172 RepID=UPI003EDC2ABD